MFLDVAQFGNGAGVVLIGFVAGMTCKYLFEAIAGIRRI